MASITYRRDVTFQKDQTCMMNKKMERTMAIIDNLVISSLNNQGFSNHAQAQEIQCLSC